MYQQKKRKTTADEEVGYILEIWLFVRSVTRPCGGSYISKHVVRNGGEDESGLSVLHVKQKRLEQRARENTGRKKVVGATGREEGRGKAGVCNGACFTRQDARQVTTRPARSHLRFRGHCCFVSCFSSTMHCPTRPGSALLVQIAETEHSYQTKNQK